MLLRYPSIKQKSGTTNCPPANNERRKTMKIMTAFLCLLFLAGSSVYGDQADSHGTESAQIKVGEVSPQGGSHLGPPPEAYKACEGKTEGSTAQFTSPHGEKITGTCMIADGRLVLRPDRPSGDSRDKRRGPPPEAYAACLGKSAGSVAQFVNPRGETVKGTCESEDGKMVLRPDSNRQNRQR
jgi:hypothetical protein